MSLRVMLNSVVMQCEVYVLYKLLTQIYEISARRPAKIPAYLYVVHELSWRTGGEAWYARVPSLSQVVHDTVTAHKRITSTYV